MSDGRRGGALPPLLFALTLAVCTATARDPLPTRRHDHHHHRCVHDAVHTRVADLITSMEVPYESAEAAASRHRTATVASEMPEDRMTIQVVFDPLRCVGGQQKEPSGCSCRSAGQPVVTDTATGHTTLCGAADVPTQRQRSFLEAVVASAAELAGRSLSLVRRRTGTLSLAQRCAHVSVPACLRRGAAADYVLFVTSLPSSDPGRDADTGAWALPCQTDQLGRPTAGVVNILRSMLPSEELLSAVARGGSDPEGNRVFRNAAMIVLHEMYHALGFTPYFWANGDAGGKPMPGWFGGAAAVVDGKMATPTVRRLATEYFGCEVDGVELETGGDSSSTGSHWEATVMGQELMTASILMSDLRVVSPLTLAYFEDTGHYRPHYAAVADAPPVFTWGKGTCPSVLRACAGPGQCQKASAARCSQDRLGVARCGGDVFSSCPSLLLETVCAEAVGSDTDRRASAICLDAASPGTGGVCASVKLCGVYANGTAFVDVQVGAADDAPVQRCTPGAVVADGTVACGSKAALAELCRLAAEPLRWRGLDGLVHRVGMAAVAAPSWSLQDTCPIEERRTLKGCVCLQEWTVRDAAEKHCTDYCCSFGGEEKWCFVADTTCEGTASGVCDNPISYEWQIRTFKTALLVIGIVLLGLSVGLYFCRKRQLQQRERVREAAQQQQQQDQEAAGNAVVGAVVPGSDGSPVVGIPIGPGHPAPVVAVSLAYPACGTRQPAEQPPPPLAPPRLPAGTEGDTSDIEAGRWETTAETS
eukprot:Rhum_TRINITY_DN14630_c17_g1::Rhum_TRINITY_DN14630_c17_g1_i1::g.105429::m.105429